MATFEPITKRDDPAQIAALAARYEALLAEALAIARRIAQDKPQFVRDILATGTVEGLAKLESKVAAVSYRARSTSAHGSRSSAGSTSSTLRRRGRRPECSTRSK